MSGVRVLVLGMPAMLRQVIEEGLSGEPGVVVVEQHSAGAGAEARVREARADFVIVPLDEEAGEPRINELLTEHPGIAVLGVSSDGRRGLLYEMRPHKVPIGELSRQALLDAVHRVAGGP